MRSLIVEVSDERQLLDLSGRRMHLAVYRNVGADPKETAIHSAYRNGLRRHSLFPHHAEVSACG